MHRCRIPEIHTWWIWQADSLMYQFEFAMSTTNWAMSRHAKRTWSPALRKNNLDVESSAQMPATKTVSMRKKSDGNQIHPHMPQNGSLSSSCPRKEPQESSWALPLSQQCSPKHLQKSPRFPSIWFDTSFASSSPDFGWIGKFLSAISWPYLPQYQMQNCQGPAIKSCFHNAPKTSPD